jgi:hypothetical protein
MAHRQVASLALAALLALLAACPKPPPPAPPVEEAKPAPGAKLLLSHEALSREINCPSLQLPFLLVEKNALSPERIKPGGEVHHRLVYAFCPAGDAKEESGTLTRRLTLKGKTVFLDQTRDFALAPGRSAVDAFFLVPESAPPGAYVLEVGYKSSGRGKSAPGFSVKETLVVE